MLRRDGAGLPRTAAPSGRLRARLAHPDWHQLLRFLLTSGISAMITVGLPILLVELAGFPERRAVQIAFASAYVFNLVVVRGFVYRSSNHWARDLVVYMVVNGLFRLAEYGLFVALTAGLGLAYYLALVAVLGLSTVAKFFAYRFVFT